MFSLSPTWSCMPVARLCVCVCVCIIFCLRYFCRAESRGSWYPWREDAEVQKGGQARGLTLWARSAQGHPGDWREKRVAGLWLAGSVHFLEGFDQWLGERIHLQCRRPGLIPGSGRSPGGGNGNPLQYSCLKIPMDGWSPERSHGVGHNWVTKHKHMNFLRLSGPWEGWLCGCPEILGP